ncbi:MAG: DNA polymerase III subunit chi [Pseudomonadota bacterium]
MTRIDFHTNVPDKVAYACRLTRKAYLAHNRIVLLAQDAAQLAELDRALWTFSATDFLPHALADDTLAADSAIVLTEDDGAPLPHHDILINLSRHQPRQPARFARVFEIVSQEQQDAAAGRQRYVAYKQQQYLPTHFVAGQA